VELRLIGKKKRDQSLHAMVRDLGQSMGFLHPFRRIWAGKQYPSVRGVLWNVAHILV
jgi:hypothetical protein